MKKAYLIGIGILAVLATTVTALVITLSQSATKSGSSDYNGFMPVTQLMYKSIYSLRKVIFRSQSTLFLILTKTLVGSKPSRSTSIQMCPLSTLVSSILS